MDPVLLGVLFAAFVAVAMWARDSRDQYLNERDLHEWTRQELSRWMQVVLDAGIQPPKPVPPPLVEVRDGSTRERLKANGVYITPSDN